MKDCLKGTNHHELLPPEKPDALKDYSFLFGEMVFVNVKIAL